MDQDYGSDFETNRKYLTFSWWLLHRGWSAIMDKVEGAVKDVFGALAPRDNVTFETLSELVLEVRKRVEGASEEERRSQKWLAFLLPPRSEEEVVLRESGVSDSSPPTTPLVPGSPTISTSLRRLLDETADLIDSPTFAHVLTLTLDAAFSVLIDNKMASLAYNITTDPGQPSSHSLPGNTDEAAVVIPTEARVQEVTDEDALSLSSESRHKLAKLATILAVFTRQAHAIGSGGNINSLIGAAGPDIPGLTGPPLRDTNEYLAAMETVRDLEAFAAVVYSSNFEFEGVEVHDNSGLAYDAEDGGRAVSGGEIGEEGLVAQSTQDNLESAWGNAVTR